MAKLKNSTAKVIDLNAGKAQQTDPLSASVIARFARQAEALNFIRTAVQGLARLVSGWNSRHTLTRDLNAMPDYLLRDIGVRRDEIPALISGDLQRGSLDVSPTGNQSAPAFYEDKDDKDGTPLAA
jgi:uncharacterized protein YjiS (DUF1127 family)